MCVMRVLPGWVSLPASLTDGPTSLSTVYTLTHTLSPVSPNRNLSFSSYFIMTEFRFLPTDRSDLALKTISDDIGHWFKRVEASGGDTS